MKIAFSKMHGAGNDFILIDDREGVVPADGRRLAAMAAQRTGVGCEGVILVQKSDNADFKMRFFNPDGSEAELCGNGARCVAAFARDIGAVSGRVMCFETLAGIVDAEIVDEMNVKVWMPEPKGLDGDFVNSGVPHKIVAVDSVGRIDVEKEGRQIRLADEYAPHGTNVDFACYRPPHRVSVRTYERGVEAETGACGTGAVAVAVVGVSKYAMEFPVKVKTVEGYELVVDGEYENGIFSSITLSGPVKKVFDGVIEWDSLDIVTE